MGEPSTLPKTAAPVAENLPVGIVGLAMGGPDSLDAVEPFLCNLFSNPAIIQLGWARPLQPFLARLISRRRAPFSRRAYAQIGGRSPIREQTEAQVAAVAAALRARGVNARPYVAMDLWHPLSTETAARLAADGIRRIVALTMYPQYSSTTTGSSLRSLATAILGRSIQMVCVERYPDARGYVLALADRIQDAVAELPESERSTAPILFSAHGLPERYVRKGDPYLDDIRTTVAAVTRELELGERARLCFQSALGRGWLQPSTRNLMEALANEGRRSLVICPVAFTCEHLETLQEIDIVYREEATALGLTAFARARAVGRHPAYIQALAELAHNAIANAGWAPTSTPTASHVNAEHPHRDLQVDDDTQHVHQRRDEGP